MGKGPTLLTQLKVSHQRFLVFIHEFQTFKLSVELQLNTKIESVQSNWGGEYKPFSALLASYGILHRLICPHTHHQNGVVERKHRHIVDLGLTLLHRATLPLQFWDYACHCSLFD